MNDEFYIGYNPVAPIGLRRFVRRVVIGVSCAAAAVCAVTLLLQSRYHAKTFEYGVVKPWTGMIAAVPYPTLVTNDGTPYLLVAPGKHGFKPDSIGSGVRLNGTLIQFGPNRMLEVMSRPEPTSMTVNVLSYAVSNEIGRVTLTGEIVDTKCHFGVMQPGNGKVHRGCAARCIAGGIPPGLLVRDRDGSLSTVLLAGADGRELYTELLPYVAEPVRINGTLVRSAGLLVLRADPSDISRE